MSEFNDFLREMAEAKKQKKIALEESNKSLGDFLSVVAEAKAADPKHQMLKEVKSRIQEDITDLFGQLVQELPVQVERVDQLVEVVQSIDAIEATEEVKPLPVVEEVAVPEVKPAAEQVPMDVIDKYLRRDASFQQPEPDKAEPSIRALQDKLKFLEQAIGRIAATGPGSGEVNFRWLDDVNRATMTDGNNNWVLEYDSATGKVQFTNNIGPISTIAMDVAGPDIIPEPGTLSWNAVEDCLNITQSDGSTLQAGLENYIRVYNNTGSTLANGTVVRFSGVFINEDYVPECVPHIADGSIPPLYTIGVLTNEIPASTVGRATVLGYVRTLNTTGSNVGETWVAGDLLYVSPTNPGKMTKVKPTAPNIVVSVAAVLRSHATEGILLVRPTIFPRLHYGVFSDTTDQAALAINTPYGVKYNTVDIANGHSIVNDTRVVAANSGLYNYQFSLQLSSSSSSQKQVYIWARKNGVDIANSATRKTISGNGYYDVAAWNFVVSMNANDYFELMWAVDDIGVRIDAPPATAFCPAAPSAILTVTEAAL